MSGGGTSRPRRELAARSEPIPASLRIGDRQVILEVIERCAPPDLVPRLRQFHQVHPDVDITWRARTWQATIRGPDGERTVIRWGLRELLDFLEEWSRAAAEMPRGRR